MEVMRLPQGPLVQCWEQVATHNLQHGYVVACNVASKDLVKPERGSAVAGKAPLPTAAYQQRQQSQDRQQTLWDRYLRGQKSYALHKMP